MKKNSELSPRETQIVRLIWRGLTAQAIGQQLAISTRTVEVHQLNIHRKWKVRNVAGVLRKAVEAGVVG